VYVNNARSLEELLENIRHEFLLFPYSNFDVCPETYSHDVRHA
jgi:hypothetical protein